VTPAELEKELAGGRLRPAYLLAGSEALLREDSLALLRHAVLDQGPRDFNHDRLDGDSLAPGRLLDAIRALPVMADRRLVELREPEARRGGGVLGEALTTALDELRGQDQTVLVVSAARIDRRSRWVKSFRAPAALVSCDPPKGSRALVGFVKREAERSGVPLDSGAADALVEAVGSQLLLLRRELEKAALFAGPGRKVTRDQVAETASLVAEEPIWDLTDAIGEGRTPQALHVLRRLLRTGSPPPVLLGSLASHFRKLSRTRSGQAPSGHPFAVRKLERQAGRYSVERLVTCLHAIHDVDEVLKGQGGLPPDIALERLVIGLAG